MVEETKVKDVVQLVVGRIEGTGVVGLYEEVGRFDVTGDGSVAVVSCEVFVFTSSSFLGRELTDADGVF